MFCTPTVCCVMPRAYMMVPGLLFTSVSAIFLMVCGGTPEICEPISSV